VGKDAAGGPPEYDDSLPIVFNRVYFTGKNNEILINPYHRTHGLLASLAQILICHGIYVLNALYFLCFNNILT
jgi:hypothetical protein